MKLLIYSSSLDLINSLKYSRFKLLLTSKKKLLCQKYSKMEKSHEYKVVTLGEGRVGKTSLTLRFAHGLFHDNEASTLQANFLSKAVNVDSKSVKMNIWDTAGQEKFRSIASNYYRQAKGALIVYDITDKATFDRVVAWVKELNQQAEPNISIVICGNKCDRESERQIPKQIAQDYAKKIGAAHFHTSAKTGKGVDEAFQELARGVLTREEESNRKAEFNQQRNTRMSKRIKITSSPTEKNQTREKKDKCC